VGSAVDTGNGPIGSQGIDSMESPGGFPGNGARANPVAQEIPVNATGTRPGDGSAKRELFSEETITVLLFADGAVIRLAAAVATGQLLFLTNKNTRKEVVCQVIGKRVFRPTSCYVELQFTEKMENFWGVEFPAVEASIAPKQVAQARPVETVPAVEAVEDTEYVLEEPAPAPSKEEVEHLRDEVEMLRQQLREMSRAGTGPKMESNPESKSEPIEGSKPKRIQAPATAARASTRPEDTIGVAIPWPKEPEMVQAELAREAAPEEARSSHVKMQLPRASDAEPEIAGQESPVTGSVPQQQTRPQLPPNDPEADLLDELLPKPALDFSKAPKRRAKEGEPYSIYKPERAKFGKLALGILSVVLAGALGIGVWQLGLVNRLAALRLKKNAVAPAVVKPSAAAKTAESTQKPAAGPDAAGAGGAAVVAADGKTATDTGAAEAAKKAEESTVAPVAVEAEKPVDVPAKTSVGLKSKKKAAAAEEHVAGAADSALVAEDAPVVPAKLLKSVAPVYPPDAMRRFITGDVTLQAEVDERGRVRNAEVVTGPSALREAALDALKQYQYAAATRGGKGVASEVKVKIKFWFDP
jgi:TonB family protein